MTFPVVFLAYITDIRTKTDVAHVLLATAWTSGRDGSILKIDPASLAINCTNLDSPFKKNISSVEVFDGVVCDFYV